jgi:hypothetical protein
MAAMSTNSLSKPVLIPERTNNHQDATYQDTAYIGMGHN